MDLFALLHDRLSATMMLFMAAVGVWGVIAYLRGQSVTGSYAGALAIGRATANRYALSVRTNGGAGAAVRVVIPPNTEPAASAVDLQPDRAVHLRTGRAWHHHRSLSRCAGASSAVLIGRDRTTEAANRISRGRCRTDACYPSVARLSRPRNFRKAYCILASQGYQFLSNEQCAVDPLLC